MSWARCRGALKISSFIEDMALEGVPTPGTQGVRIQRGGFEPKRINCLTADTGQAGALAAADSALWLRIARALGSRANARIGHSSDTPLVVCHGRTQRSVSPFTSLGQEFRV